MIRSLVDDVRAGVPKGVISAKFHNAMAEAVVTVAAHVGLERVVLSGGCFQNRYLLERTVARLAAEGFRPCWPQRVPPNDGGIALGQVVAVRWGITDAREECKMQNARMRQNAGPPHPASAKCTMHNEEMAGVR